MKIICIGRNYVAHAEELNNEVPKEPLVFMKPESALNSSGMIDIPEFTSDLHYELELVLRISREAKNVSKEEASQYYDAVALGIDFTARDVQAHCKAKSHPWEKAKAFDNSATLSSFTKCEELNMSEIRFALNLNGEKVQDGNSQLMIFDFDTLISYCSKFFTLNEGDLLYTGTPAGVGPVKSGDILECYLENEILQKVIIN